MISINKKCLMVVLIVLAILAIVVMVVGPEKVKNLVIGDKLSSQEAANLAIEYINKNMVSEGATASLMDIVEESGLYKIHLKISDQEYDSYISTDGHILFPQNWIKLIETPKEEPAEEPAAVDSAVLEALAKCLTEKGFKFYGSSSCGWCKKEKDLFGSAVQYLPYVECSDSNGQLTQVCKDAKINSFPTWTLPDGTQSSGYKTLEELSQLSGCSL
jgi:hypothetical protein